MASGKASIDFSLKPWPFSIGRKLLLALKLLLIFTLYFLLFP